jgi:hypothetical protein
VSLDISLQINKLTDEKWKMQKDNELDKDTSTEKRASLLSRISSKKKELGKENTNSSNLNKDSIER